MLDQGVRPRSLYLEVLGPALGEVGSRWQRGVVSVAQEHLATAIVTSIMATLASRLEEPPAIQRRAMLACTEGELHDVGLRMIGDFLEADGWEVLYLGVLTPADEFEGLVVSMKPDVIGLSTTLTTHLATAAALISRIRRLAEPPLIIVGGRAYGDAAVARGVGADEYLPDAGSLSAFLRDRFGADADRVRA